MSRAEDLAKKYCEGSSFEDACMERPAYIAGYHQAEKDNELTWEDVENIITISYKLDKEDEISGKYAKLMTHYQEVLKRYKENR